MITDTYDGAIRRYDPHCGRVTTRAAGLGEPTGVLPDPADPGALLVAE